MDELERDIRRFVSESVGVRLDRVHLRSTLGEDFGLDGDDAVEFFGAYADAFQVDVTALHAEWSEFFGPEGLAGLSGLFLLVFLLVPFAVAAILVFSVGWTFGFQLPAEPGWKKIFAASGLVMIATVGGVLTFAWRLANFWPYKKLFPLLKQITVAELIEAARRGRWR